MRTTLLRTTCLLIAALLVVACTRDRATPETTSTPVTMATTASKPSSAEPAVESTSGTPAPTGEAAGSEDTPTPDETPSRKTFDYQVKPGDTLADIAERFDASVQTLRELNFLLDDNIFAGQVLAVPYIEGMTAEGAPTPTPAPFKYVVEAGDTLTTIALMCGIDKPITIVEANNLSDPNNLAVGTELVIPGCQLPSSSDSTGTGTASAGETATQSDTSTGSTNAGSTGATSGGEQVTHVVQPGESLLQIATEYGIDSAALAEANGITNGNLIRAGQKLVIPGVTRRQALEARGTRYVVQSGESLSVIAEKYGVTVEAIMAANGIDDPNTIVVGQELLIPAAE